jgi:RNA polymerase sigma factor (sigma-70 family)
MTDQELLAEIARTASPEAFAALVERHTPMVYATCLRILKDPHAAEDATQTTFLVLLRRARTLPRNSMLAGWLYATAQTSARDALRAAARRKRHEREAAVANAARATGGADATVEEENQQAAKEQLDQAIAALPPAQRDVVVLRYLYGFNAEDTARQMKTSQETVHVQLSRALSRIRLFCQQRGATVSASVITGILAQCGPSTPPAALVKTITTACLAKGAATAATSGAARAAVRWGVRGAARSAAGSGAKTAAILLVAAALAIPAVIALQQSPSQTPPVAKNSSAPPPVNTPTPKRVDPPAPIDDDLPEGARVLFRQRFDANTSDWRGKIVPKQTPAGKFALECIAPENDAAPYIGELRSPFVDAGWRTDAHTYLRFRYCVEKFREIDIFKLMFKRKDLMNFSGFTDRLERGQWATMSVRIDKSVSLDMDRTVFIQEGEAIHSLVWMARSSDEKPPPDARFWIDDVILFQCSKDIPAIILTAGQ